MSSQDAITAATSGLTTSTPSWMLRGRSTNLVRRPLLVSALTRTRPSSRDRSLTFRPTSSDTLRPQKAISWIIARLRTWTGRLSVIEEMTFSRSALGVAFGSTSRSRRYARTCPETSCSNNPSWCSHRRNRFAVSRAICLPRWVSGRLLVVTKPSNQTTNARMSNRLKSWTLVIPRCSAKAASRQCSWSR